MDKILDGFEILKSENMGLSVNDVINILQKVDNSDTLKTIEGISEDKMKKDRQYYLDIHPYEIYFSETEGRWRTQIADASKKSGRRDIKRKNKIDLENLIIEHYKAEKKTDDTFSVLYYEWLLTYKVLECSKATIERLHTSYKHYFEKSEIADMSIKEITPFILKKFLLAIVSKENLNYKAYSAIATIPRQLFDYCIEKELLEENPMTKVKIKKNTFRHDKKADAETQAYTDAEKNLLEEVILKDFEQHPEHGTVGLALILLFQTGLRSGEIVALKPSDIKRDYLTIERTETSYSLIHPDGTKSDVIYEIKDFPKTQDSNRDVPLSNKAKQVLELTIQWNKTHNFDSDTFLFLDQNGERMIRKRLDTAIRKYCKMLEMNPRSCHKIRKTFISTLIDSVGISNDEVRKIAGHSDLAVTNSCYVFNRNPASQTLKVINEVL